MLLVPPPQAGDLPECYFPGDGVSCRFECARLDGDMSAMRPPVGCDMGTVGQISCTNLTLAKKGLLPHHHFICADTGLPCGGGGDGSLYM
eukprot:SAG22_NODE_1243_length_5022_cov_3.983953_6_plen_90_part_00